MRRALRILFCLPVLALLAACGGGKDQPADLSSDTGPGAEALYAQAAAELDAGNEVAAAQTFAEVERLYPYSPWAPRAELMGAYAAYQDGRYDAALDAVERYITLRPASPQAPYAWYLRALIHYAQISDVQRDQAATRRADAALADVIARFPDTDYARDAKLKRDLVRDHLAGHEMQVGRYYQKRGHLGAAMGRYQVVIDEYQTTAHAAEALFRMVEVYITLGLDGQAQRMAAVLGHNYPGSRWYARAYKLMDPEGREALIAERSWTQRAKDDLLGPR